MIIGDKKTFEGEKSVYTVVHIGKKYIVLESEKGGIRSIPKDKSAKFNPTGG